MDNVSPFGWVLVRHRRVLYRRFDASGVHVPACRESSRLVARVLRRGGSVVLMAPAYDWMRSTHDQAVHDVRRSTRGTIRSLMTNAGGVGCSSRTPGYPAQKESRQQDGFPSPALLSGVIEDSPNRCPTYGQISESVAACSPTPNVSCPGNGSGGVPSLGCVPMKRPSGKASRFMWE